MNEVEVLGFLRVEPEHVPDGVTDVSGQNLGRRVSPFERGFASVESLKLGDSPFELGDSALNVLRAEVLGLGGRQFGRILAGHRASAG